MVANTTKRHILRELADGPIGADELREEDGTPAELDFVPDPSSKSMRLTDAGHEMLFVAFVLERWLQASPLGPLELGSRRANEAIAALVCGWSSTVVHALSREPLALPSLSQQVDKLSYSLLEEHIDAMERDCQLEPAIAGETPTRYGVSVWLREAVAPLAAAARLERRGIAPDTAPIDDLDVRAAFHLTLPLLELPAGMSGTALLSAKLENGDHRPVRVVANVEEGQVTVRSAQPGEGASALAAEHFDASASGPSIGWLNAVIDGDPSRLKVSGDEELGGALLAGLHDRLFGIPVGKTS